MHIRRLNSGRWRVIVQAGGRRRSATADTKQEVQRLGARILLDLGATPTRATLTVADIIGRYLADGEARWSPTYLADVEAVTDRLPEQFTSRRAATIRPGDISDLYRQLQGKGWTGHRLRRLHGVLHKAWADAIEVELLNSNIVDHVRKPAAPERELTVPTHGDVAAVLAAATDLEQLAIRLAAATGARRGELVALQWRDVELDTGTITIRRSLRYTPATKVTPGSTKTGAAGHRRVVIDPGTIALLQAWHDDQTGHAKRFDLAAPVWVLADDAGSKPWRPDRLSHAFVAARKRAKVDGVRLHDIRHYVATTMLQAGKPPIEVANQLGHSTPITTLRVYAHYLPGVGGDAAADRAAHWT